MTELRVYLPIYDLQPQFSAYLSTPLRARGYPPFEGQHSLIIEVSPALAIHRITDLALKAAPDMEPGILFTERQYGLLELHSSKRKELDEVGVAEQERHEGGVHVAVGNAGLQRVRHFGPADDGAIRAPRLVEVDLGFIEGAHPQAFHVRDRFHRLLGVEDAR